MKTTATAVVFDENKLIYVRNGISRLASRDPVRSTSTRTPNIQRIFEDPERKNPKHSKNVWGSHLQTFKKLDQFF